MTMTTDSADAVDAHEMDELERLRRRVRALEQERRHLVAAVEILDSIMGSFQVSDIVQSVVHKLGEMYGLDRCSVFLAEPGGRTARLLATYEDPSIYNYIVDLERYPELRQAIETNSTVSIEDVSHDTLVEGVRGALVDRGIQAITVVPLSWRGVAVGAIFSRTFRDGPPFTDADLRFHKVVASLTAKALHTAHRIDKLQRTRSDEPLPERERHRATLVAYMQRLLQEFSEHENPGSDRLAPALSQELERLVGLSLTVLAREAKPKP
jgi:GAF domain-containing protein